MTEADTSNKRIDRRSALKKAAVAGTVAWTAPTILSSRAQAVDFLPGTQCTAKCSPTGSITIAGTAVGCPCGPGAPGQQDGEGRILAGTVVTSSLNCPCGGQAQALVCQPSAGGTDCFLIRPKPGNINLPGESIFDVGAYIYCVDRSGDTIWKYYQSVAAASIKPGSCQGISGKSFTWLAVLNTPCAEGCGVPSCATIPCAGPA